MITCRSEEFIPIPTPVNRPYFDVRVKAAAACKAAELLLSEGYSGEGKEVTDEIKKEVAEATKEIAVNDITPTPKINTVLSTPAGAVLVHNILKQFDSDILEQTKRMRNYVTNRLIIESDNPDPKIRLDALKTLGKIGGVDLFIERREVTIQNKSTVDLENTLRDKLQRIMGVTTAEDAVIRNEISAKSELGGLKGLFK